MSFWSKFPQPTCLPDSCQCEFVYDALIRQPSSFWTSGIYVLFALFQYTQIKVKGYTFQAWTAAIIVIGLGSMFAHGSFTRFSMAIDFATIILTISLFPLINRLKVRALSHFKISLFLIFYYILLALALYSMPKWYKIILCLIIFLVSIKDQFIEIKKSGKEITKDLRIFFITLLVSFLFFMLDEFRVSCVPQSLLQWHSLWHIGTATAIYYFGKWKFS